MLSQDGSAGRRDASPKSSRWSVRLRVVGWWLAVARTAIGERRIRPSETQCRASFPCAEWTTPGTVKVQGWRRRLSGVLVHTPSFLPVEVLLPNLNHNSNPTAYPPHSASLRPSFHVSTKNFSVMFVRLVALLCSTINLPTLWLWCQIEPNQRSMKLNIVAT
jgi:hypothetical protein